MSASTIIQICAATKAQFLAEQLREGEVYAGLLLGKNGEPDQHIFLLPGQLSDVNHKKAADWAASIGGDLPTRREQSLLFANCKEQFDERYYWSSERHASDSGYAWIQDFYGGSQSYDDVDYGYRARAVRRLILSPQ